MHEYAANERIADIHSVLYAMTCSSLNLNWAFSTMRIVSTISCEPVTSEPVEDHLFVHDIHNVYFNNLFWPHSLLSHISSRQTVPHSCTLFELHNGCNASQCWSLEAVKFSHLSFLNEKTRKPNILLRKIIFINY